MRPGVCTAPEPAPERDRPSEGCQLLVRQNRNYLKQIRQVTTQHTTVALNRNAFPCYVFGATFWCDDCVIRLCQVLTNGALSAIIHAER